MAGKREKRYRKRASLRLRGVVVMLALVAAVLTMTSSGSQGIAADSPVEDTPPVEVTVIPEKAAEPEKEAEQEPVKMPEPEIPEEVPESVNAVPESAAVEDTYFDTVAFLGDSRTEGFKLYSGLKKGTYYHAVGATVESVFTKSVDTAAGKMPLLDAMAKSDFEKIYVMLGVNELGWNGTKIYHNQYAKLIDRLREDHPDAEIVLQTLMPVSAKQEEKKTYVNNARIAAYNEVIKQLAEEKNCPYIDVAEAVVDEDGCLRSEWSADGVHLNTKGCQIWLEYLRTHTV